MARPRRMLAWGAGAVLVVYVALCALLYLQQLHATYRRRLAEMQQQHADALQRRAEEAEAQLQRRVGGQVHEWGETEHGWECKAWAPSQGWRADGDMALDRVVGGSDVLVSQLHGGLAGDPAPSVARHGVGPTADAPGEGRTRAPNRVDPTNKARRGCPAGLVGACVVRAHPLALYGVF